MLTYPNVPKTSLQVIYEDVGAHLASPKSDNYYNNTHINSVEIFH